MRKRARKNAPDLHCHSTFSLLDGFGSPKSVVERAKELGWGAAALTEHGWMGSAPQFYQACRDNNIKPILGCEFYVVPDEILGIRDKEVRSSSRHLTVLALSREGYHNLVKWQNISMQPENFYYKPRISLSAMIENAPHPLHHNVILSGCLGGELSQTILTQNGMRWEAAVAYVESMKTAFPNFFIEVQNHYHDYFIGKGFEAYEEMVGREALVRDTLAAVAKATNTPVVLTNDSHYQVKEQRKAHIAMLASKLQRWGQDDSHHARSQEHVSKAYVRDYGYWRNYMQSMEELEDRTPVAKGACDNALEIVREADLRLDPLDRFSYSVPFSGYRDPIAEIRHRSRSRFKHLRRRHGSIVEARFEHELAAMGDFAHYLIMMSDFIQWANEQGILTEVRGSANASLVCYCLKIHDIDPIKYKLTFERFVNPERKKLPDIDIDIEADRYEDFMEFVKQYVSEREGEGQVRLICNYGTLANRGTFRLVAESLGVGKETIDEIAGLLPQMIDSGIVDEEDDAYAVLKDQFPEIYELAADVFDNLKSVSQHACGWIFGTKDRPLDQWIPLYHIASSGQAVTQYDYKSIEKFGLNKGDFLRQKYLSVMKRCANMIGMTVADLKKIPLDDEDTMSLIRQGRTEGVFTLQGKTNRTGGIEVEPVDEHGVIASVAIYRPSLTRPGYHRTYNARRRGDDHVSFPHDVAEEVLGESYGLPIFQEQILELGYRIGFDHVEAQELLDAIKMAKGVGRGAAAAFEKIHPRFVQRAIDVHGMPATEAEAVWDLVGSFQGYGFNRAHATGYGIRSDRAAYLKTHHPQEFFVSLLDVYPEKHKYVAGAKAEGFRFLPPDINQAGAGFSKGVDDKSIRVGLARVHGVGPVAVKSILAKQPFSSVEDLKERTPGTAIKQPVVEALAAVGAFESFGIKRTDEDAEMFRLLGFLLDKPKAMHDLTKPRFTTRRQSDGGWKHLGYDSGCDVTGPRASVSKRFWIPNLENDKLLTKKASAWARVKTWLLLAVDENGLPFHIMVNEDKPQEADYLHWIVKKHKGSVICMDGAIRKPFDTDGPMGFRFYDVTGAFNGEPQVWGDVDEKDVKAFTVLHKRKRTAKKRAA